MTRLSAAAGGGVCAAARGRGWSPLVARRLYPARSRHVRCRTARPPAPEPAPTHVVARHRFRAGGPFRDLWASLGQRPMPDEARRSPDHRFGGPSRGGVTTEPHLAPAEGRPAEAAIFLSADECARRAMLSRKAIYRAIESGELLAFRVRARLRVPEEEFRRWMTADPVSRAPRVPSERKPARRPAPEGSFRSVLRKVEGGQV
jgi:excisionase family DNA binding protein